MLIKKLAFMSQILNAIGYEFSESLYGEDRSIYPHWISFEKTSKILLINDGLGYTRSFTVDQPRLAFTRALLCYSMDEQWMPFDRGTAEFNSSISGDVKVGFNSIIGGIGFGLQAGENGIPLRIPHFGNVIIGEGSEIGNCTNIDRGVLGHTTLGKNVKVDSHVHIAHNVEVGDNTLIVAGSVICGSVKIGKGCWIGAGAIIRQRLTIGDGAYIGMGAVVTKDVPAGEQWYGNPAKNHEKK